MAALEKLVQAIEDGDEDEAKVALELSTNQNNVERLDEKEGELFAEAQQRHRQASVSASKIPLFDKVGLLTKLGGGVKNWLQRGFALSKERQELLYFRSVKEFALYADDPIKERNRVAGCIPLANSRLYVAAKYSKDPNCLELTTDPKKPEEFRHYYLIAQSASEFGSWITALCEAGATFVTPDPACAELRYVNEARQSALFQPPVFGLQDYVEKRGQRNKALKLSFFRLEVSREGQMALQYYPKADSVEPKGTIPLLTAEVREDRDDELRWGLKVPSREYFFQCKTKQDRDRWVQAVTLIKDQLRTNPNATSFSLPRSIELPAARAAGADPAAAAPQPPPLSVAASVPPPSALASASVGAAAPLSSSLPPGRAPASRSPAPFESWGVAEVGRWLESLSLGDYVAAFSKEQITGDVLSEISDEMLKALGVDALGHRLKILKSVREMKSSVS